MPLRVSHHDIALRLSLNKSTVSRALRDHPKIPLRTRERVQQAAAQMGYRPDPLLSELAASRWKETAGNFRSVIAYIDCTPPEDTYWTTFLPSMRDQARRFGYGLEVFHRSDFTTSAALQRVLRNRGITEVILGAILGDALRVELDWSKFICIQMLPNVVQLPFHSVMKDHFASIVLAWEMAVSHGYRRIAIALTEAPFKIRDDLLRISAVDACQRRIHPHLPALPAFQTTGPFSGKKFARWLEANEPDVLIGFNNFYQSFLESELHLKLPFIDLHKTPGSPLSGIVNPSETSGREGINLLHYCRQTHQWGIPAERIDHVILPSWSEGNSLPMKTPGSGTGG